MGLDRRIDESELVVFNVYRQLKQMTREIDAYRDRVARNFGISGAGFYVLVAIYLSSEWSYKDLATHLGLAANTVSTLTSSLVEQEFVSVTVDAADRRIGRLKVTDKGTRLVEEVWSLIHQTDTTESYEKFKAMVLSNLRNFYEHNVEFC